MRISALDNYFDTRQVKGRNERCCLSNEWRRGHCQHAYILVHLIHYHLAQRSCGTYKHLSPSAGPRQPLLQSRSLWKERNVLLVSSKRKSPWRRESMWTFPGVFHEPGRLTEQRGALYQAVSFYKKLALPCFQWQSDLFWVLPRAADLHLHKKECSQNGPGDWRATTCGQIVVSMTIRIPLLHSCLAPATYKQHHGDLFLLLSRT